MRSGILDLKRLATVAAPIDERIVARTATGGPELRFLSRPMGLLRIVDMIPCRP
jgi:hypothetical protein